MSIERDIIGTTRTVPSFDVDKEEARGCPLNSTIVEGERETILEREHCVELVFCNNTFKSRLVWINPVDWLIAARRELFVVTIQTISSSIASWTSDRTIGNGRKGREEEEGDEEDDEEDDDNEETERDVFQSIFGKSPFLPSIDAA